MQPIHIKNPDTLLHFLQTHLAGISRNKAKSILAAGVAVNGRLTTRFDYALRVGDTVEIRKHQRTGDLGSKFVKLVYEDAHLVVVEKSEGILSMATSHHSFCVKTVLDHYFERTNQRCRAHVVHRLDRDTSGLLVYAKTREAEQILEHNWRDIVTDRRYMALLSGVVAKDHGTIESWLKDNKAYITQSSPTDNGGKYAVTHFFVRQRGKNHSLVEFKLETGRKNQIRVHAADLGNPVCGDIKYGNGDDPIGRLALHAFRLNFYHPVTGEPLRFETEVPRAFRSVFRPDR